MRITKYIIDGLNNILFNASQEHFTKDDVLNAIKSVIQDYNRMVSQEYKVEIRDFRKGRNI